MERYQPDQYGRMMPDAHGQWVSLRAAELTALDAAQKSSADAQATIAALQARVDNLERQIANRGGLAEIDDARAKAGLHDQMTAQLTQRTAERDCARRRVDELEAREVDVVLLRDDLEQRTAELEAAKQWKLQLCNLTPGGSEFADDPAYCAEWVRKSRENQHNAILDKYREAKSLKAELESVRGLIKALPKVEGEINQRLVSAMYGRVDGTKIYFGPGVAALLQHRQGMEGV